MNALLSAPADGCTLPIATNSLASVNPAMRKDLPCEAFKDPQPIHALINSAPVILAPPATKATPLKEMLMRASNEGRPLSIRNCSEGYQLLVAWIGTLAQVPASTCRTGARGPRLCPWPGPCRAMHRSAWRGGRGRS